MCETKYCRRKPHAGRKLCSTCRTRKYRLEHPVESSYQNLKQNAKRRGKIFDLTLDQFREFCVRTNYIQGKGTSKESYHIDRIDENIGYTIDNLQILTNTQNIKKYLKFSEDERGKPDQFWVEKNKKQQIKIEGIPF